MKLELSNGSWFSCPMCSLPTLIRHGRCNLCRPPVPLRPPEPPRRQRGFNLIDGACAAIVVSACAVGAVTVFRRIVSWWGI